MPGDFSRKLFDSKKHYSAVLEQQGRVQLDADWNEQVDIQQYLATTESKDVIGLTGVPKKTGGFTITVASGGSDLAISPGRIYINGNLFEQDKEGITYKHQPHYLSPDLSFFSVQSSPPASPPQPLLKNGTYIVYAKGWQQEINYCDDPHIQEVALGEADTTVRLKNIWQVKLLQVANNAAATCGTTFSEWDTLVAKPSGMLNAQAVQNAAEQKPCILPPSAGFIGLENQLYRIQIVKGGNRNTATYIWSRHNASIETIVTGVSGSVISVADTGKDEVLNFANGQWVEIVETEPTIAGNNLFQIEDVNIHTREITFKTSVAQFETKPMLKLRRWDVQGTSLENGIAMQNGWVNIESGIQVSFSDGTYEAGDYWLVPARTAIANIEWPRDAGNNSIAQSPVGVQKHYCKLALINVQNGQLKISDCRPLFPSLTTICAEDICFDNTGCNFPATITNVQQALDQLCQKTSGGLCTFVAKPGKGWEKVFDNVKEGMDAQICFPAGQYPVQKAVTVTGKGDLKLTGCGLASKIIASDTEAALAFDKCRSVTIYDLYAEGGVVNVKDKEYVKRLNGVFNFSNATAVNIYNTSIKSGTHTSRTCTCITVNNNMETPGQVRIENCDLQMANWQQGILIVNTSTCYIEKNNIKTYFVNDRNDLQRFGLRNALVSNLREGAIGTAERSGANNVAITSGNFTVNFKTDPSLKGAWKKVMTATYTTPAQSAKELQQRVESLAPKLIDDKRLHTTYVNLGAFVANVTAAAKANAVGSQGITIGGRIGKDIYINNNVIAGVLQGIHAGVSHRTNTREPDTINNLNIVGNSIGITLPLALGKQDRHGIFVGNCKNTLIENNTLSITRIGNANNTIIDGIKVWGMLGPRLMITKNFAGAANDNQKMSFNIGIHVNPLQSKPRNSQWVVMWNVAPSKITTVKLTKGVVDVEGTNTP